MRFIRYLCATGTIAQFKAEFVQISSLLAQSINLTFVMLTTCLTLLHVFGSFGYLY